MLKGVLYYKMENFTTRVVGPTFRRLGQQLFNKGVELQGDLGHQDRLVPSLRCVPISDAKYPKLLDADWVAPNATLVGDIAMEEGSSVWHGVIARGDTAQIHIGKNSIVQDLVHISSSHKTQGDKVHIGDNVHVGPNATLDACVLESYSFVGMGSTVSRGATVESFGVVAAGAVIPEGTTVPSGQVWAGNPARYLRDLSQEEKHYISEQHVENQQLAQIYSEATEMSFREITNHLDSIIRYEHSDADAKMNDVLGDMGMPVTHDDLEYIEHRVYHDYVGTVDYNMKDENHEEDSHKKVWIPYEQDMTHYPEVFKMYQENYDRYEKVKKRFEEEKPMQEQSESPFTRRIPRDMSPWEKKYDDLMPRYTGTSSQ